MGLSAISELQEALPRVMTAVLREPEAPETGDDVSHMIQILDRMLDGPELAEVARRASLEQRTNFGQMFQGVVDNLRDMVSVAAQIAKFGGNAPFGADLAVALSRLEGRLTQLGFPIGPSKRPGAGAVVRRQPLTGELRVFAPLPVAVPRPPLGLLAAASRPLAEQGPALVEHMRQLLGTVNPERLEHLDGERAASAAQHLGQTLRLARTFLAQTSESEHQGQPWHGAMTDLLDRMERTIADLSDIVAAEAALNESGNRIPYEQVLERLAFQRLLPTLADTHYGQYVAVHKGRVVDADRSQRALVRRFVERFGDSSLYVGFVGPTPVVHIPTPMLRRSS
jgi:hypothetical protein